MDNTASSSLSIVILAAGLGTRMRSKVAKVLHPLAGKPLLAHVLEAARALHPRQILVVVGHQSETVKAALDAPDLTWVEQNPPLGTGHAVACAVAQMTDKSGELLVLNGDVPLIGSQDLTTLWKYHQERGNGVSLYTMHLTDPTGYGRLVRDEQNLPTAIIEEKDADSKLRIIQEVNTGTWCFDLSLLPQWLARLGVNNASGEFYLTDVLALCRQAGLSVGALCHQDPLSFAGVNSRVQLAELEIALRDRIVLKLMKEGVTFQDPSSCWLSPDVVVGMDTVILANVQLGPGVVIGEDCRIGPFCQIQNSTLGDGCIVEAFSHIDGARLAGPNQVGPFVRLRPASDLAAGVRVGNFCEVKKSRIGANSKINHLSYIGDATLGERVNVGAGTITCNYDGVHKHQTIIEDGVFIGSDTQLVAPVTVAAEAVVAAGTTITGNVPAGSLAISRVPQRHIPEWHQRRQSR
ncbi:MAG: UDP-N-acetylglucosamine diphosphorylase/glucosamine-1-phosphate N-acetyltransferase [Magnetococcales bacterium]|nr:bifunctional UDP-N-acetylglucosamine diphosphorylase/glucosamine-1-phosphate N-acetyltransferase GlmU [Magnetococcales bacterium]NGZ27187.1 UDP-N-acetylglucosamine diphosphorylase/glucosamine-1-phosphate N-acetyltransferase [Magnetococcales bacterium]